MKKEIMEKLPEWSKFNDGVKYDLVNTDDIDGVFSCRIMEKDLGFKVGYFYDFRTLYVGENSMFSTNEKLYLDCATTIDKSIDNHVQAISHYDVFNKNSVNLNNVGRYYGCTNDYYNKYCGSTLLTVMSLRNIPIPEDEDLQMILLCIDSTFLGYYSTYRQANESNRSNLVFKLGYEQLYNLQGKKTKQDFYNIIDKYNLKTKIKLIDGKLQYAKDVTLLRKKLLDTMGIDIALPEEEFVPIETYQTNVHTIKLNDDISKITKENIWNKGYYIHSLAMTGQREISYSFKKIVS